MYIPYSVLSSFPRATSSRVYTQWHMAQSLKPSLYPIPSAGSVYDDLVLFLHAFTPLITFGLICNSFRFACFVNSSLRFLIPNLHPICTCSCLFTPLTEGRSARDLTQAATSQKKNPQMGGHRSRAKVRNVTGRRSWRGFGSSIGQDPSLHATAPNQ